MFGLGMMEILVLLVLGVLLFGKRLPEVGRSVGKTIMELKRGFQGIEESLEKGDFDPDRYRSESAPLPPPRPPQRIQPTGPKFEDEPPTSATM
jgi:sec-independent protein translocase protein TatA